MKKNNNLLEAFDDEGNIQLDDDAVEVWFDYFSKLLGGSSVGDAHTAPESSCRGDESLDLSDRLCFPILVEEVQWALQRVKIDAALDQDDIGAEMMMADCLLDVWVTLFQVCWEYSIVPSIWKESVVVPVPKKQAKGLYNVDNFCSVSLSPTVCKVMCMILNNRLSGVAEEEGLIADEQGGFRKQRGCRNQVLSLVLLGQMEMLKKSQRMMIAFIDFSKANDKVDRDKLWKCLQSWV